VFSNDNPKCNETCGDIQCYIIEILTEEHWTFLWLAVVSWLPTMHGTNNR